MFSGGFNDPRPTEAMKKLPLTHGLFAIVDDDLYPLLSKYTWHAKRSGSGNTWYAECAKWNHKYKTKRIKLHHVILGTPIAGLFPDHIDRNGLNNQRSNLRLVTQSENNKNRVYPKVRKPVVIGQKERG